MPKVGLALLIALLFARQPASSRPDAAVFKDPVTISGQQATLLKEEAARLQARTESARKQFADSPFSTDVARNLANAVVTEENGLADVRSRFLKSANAQQTSAGTAYFDDLLRRYARVAGQIPGVQEARYPVVRDTALRAMSDQYTAYMLVSGSGSLTFNLDVGSSPAGASVSFRRPGDPFQKHPAGTNTTIVNLSYALWTVRAELKGAIQEKDHDPYRESNHVVHFDF